MQYKIIKVMSISGDTKVEVWFCNVNKQFPGHHLGLILKNF